MIDPGLIFIIGIVFSIVILGLYLVTLVKILKNSSIGFARRILWVLLLLFAPLVGMILYYLIDG